MEVMYAIYQLVDIFEVTAYWYDTQTCKYEY